MERAIEALDRQIEVASEMLAQANLRIADLSAQYATATDQAHQAQCVIDECRAARRLLR